MQSPPPENLLPVDRLAAIAAEKGRRRLELAALPPEEERADGHEAALGKRWELVFPPENRFGFGLTANEEETEC